MRQILMVLFAAALPLASAPPAGFAHWKASELKGFSAKLAPKIDAHKVASEQLGKFGNHSFQVAHREGSGEAELHEKQADIFVIEAGEATLTVGGAVEGGRTTAPGEVRGPSIKGGDAVKVTTGDILHIPAGVPHQMQLQPGKKVTYFVVKIDTP